MSNNGRTLDEKQEFRREVPKVEILSVAKRKKTHGVDREQASRKGVRAG